MLSHAFPRRRAFDGILAAGFVVAAVIAVGAITLWQIEKQAESTPVSRGGKLALAAGCFACHGRGDGEARFNLRQVDGKWTARSNPTFWDGGIDRSAMLVDWITHGVAAGETVRHKSLFIQMPAYGQRLSPAQIQDIAAWILSEGLKYSQGVGDKVQPAIGRPRGAEDARFVAGDRLSRRFGCYQCHGELGQGGIANPDSFKGYIPGFAGADLRALTAGGDRDEILHWIDTGRGRAIEAGPAGWLARRYLKGQATQMPAYRDQLTVAERGLLADFILVLNKKGPLGAADLERISALLNDD